MTLHSTLDVVGTIFADDRASVAIEYGLIAALVAAVLLLTLLAGMGESLRAIFEQAAEGLDVNSEG